MYGRVDQHTIEYCAKKNSCEVGFLCKVQRVWDLWSIRTIGPGFFRGGVHGSDAFRWEEDSNRGDQNKETPETSEGESIYKHSKAPLKMHSEYSR